MSILKTILRCLYKVISGTDWAVKAVGDPHPTTAEIGANFMTNYIFPFEYVSLVLLAALIGAAILIRESKGSDGDTEAEEPAEHEEVQS